MTIRPARWADLPVVAKLCAAAFYEDELFGPLMHPQRADYYEDYECFFTRRMRENWWDWTHVWWVATVQENGEEVVVGVAEWELMGSVADKHKLASLDPRRTIMPAAKTLNQLSTMVQPNRAANPDPVLRNPFPAAHHFFEHHWNGLRANSVYLDLLAIDPKYQGRGIAKELVQWGLDKAREEGVCASVVSSKPGYNFYRKMGFKHEVGMATEGEGNPLNGLESGWILFTDTPAPGKENILPKATDENGS
ncbi:acyl-CoA N-acyltransferase [Lojkania enalia]|uniref:Acyl-CoA N-acyltransferase n=1 Tax=Lojkania enalia TaxID=147567 RepID=A0A9P4KCP4_9PLEO|nr:acyl-CoA N-acyltransferase [Didymosphaeria enalia]